MVAGDGVGNDAADVVGVASEDDRFGFQASGGEFCNEGEADGAEGAAVDECEEKEDGCYGPLGWVVVFGSKCYQANDEEEEEECDGTVEVQGATAAAGHQEPGDESADDTECVLYQCEVESPFLDVE